MNSDDVKIQIEEEEELSEKDFIIDVYETIHVWCHRNLADGIYKSDFLYNTVSVCSNTVFYVPFTHPISQIIQWSPDACIQHLKKISIAGDITSTVYIYDRDAIEMCVNMLESLCEKYNLKIIK